MEVDEQTRREGLRMDLYYWLQSLTFAVVLLILLFTFVGRVIGVSGISMEPTLHDGDVLLLQSLGYEPRPGDIVVLSRTFDWVDGPIVKRVIAVEGQHVSIDYGAGTVTVDGKVLDEPYLKAPMHHPASETGTLTDVVVPEGEIFVMGDNRAHSADSRDVRLGTVDQRKVLGGARMVLLPLGDAGKLP